MDRSLARALRAVASLLLATSLACSDGISPDGGLLPERILFQATPSGSIGGDLYTVAPDGSNLVRLTSGGDAFAPAWSPDGTRIAYSRLSDPNVYVMDADGGGVTKVTTGPEEKVQPAWAPDGRSLLYVQFSSPGYAGETSLRTVSLEDGSVTVLASGDCQWPTYAPDGTRIAYVSWVPEGADPHIRMPSLFVMQPDGTGETNLLPAGMWGHRPRWSPDGGSIVFAGYAGSGPAYDVWVVHPDGTGLTRLTTSGSNGTAGFSRDGTHIVFEHAPVGGAAVLMLMKADGTDPQSIPGLPGPSLYPSWRP